ncbi:MAG TPA: T9SS type A sorting domain-containing protein, partial [Bacteroidales bacterium]|nr:T9SS type A sorting domain-containing protein [Bacteroidales bacterium]
ISNSVSKVLNSWVLETTNMSPDRLNAFNLEANDTQEASDHLPKVTDLAFTGPLAVSSVKQKQVTVLPNPASDKIDIIGEGIDSVRVIQLSTGQIIKTIFHENQGGTFRIQSGDFKPGVYLLEIKRRNNKSSHYEKIIITR